MIQFLKENGFPMTIFINTDNQYVNDEGDDCLKSTITDENGKLIWEFEHKGLRARIHWASGFFTALRMRDKNNYQSPELYNLPNELNSIESDSFIKNMLKESSDGNEGQV